MPRPVAPVTRGRVQTRLPNHGHRTYLLELKSASTRHYPIMGKAGRKHFYAINQPEEYRGVYHDYWEPDVSAMAGSSGAWHKRFEDRPSAQYFAAHGHEKGRDYKRGGSCWVCLKEEEKKKENVAVKNKAQSSQRIQRNGNQSSRLVAT